MLGDSHAIDLFNALAYNSGTRHVIGLTGGGCRPVNPKPDCYYGELEAFLRTNRGKIDNIVFTQKGSYFLADARHLPVDTVSVQKTVDFVSELEQLGFPTVWVGPQWEPNYEVEHLVPVAKPAVGEAFLSNENEHIDDVEFEIRRLLKKAQVPVAYVSKLDTIGKLTQALFLIDNEYTYGDTDHWSAKGEEIFGASLMKNAILQCIFFPVRATDAWHRHSAFGHDLSVGTDVVVSAGSATRQHTKPRRLDPQLLAIGRFGIACMGTTG